MAQEDGSVLARTSSGDDGIVARPWMSIVKRAPWTTVSDLARSKPIQNASRAEFIYEDSLAQLPDLNPVVIGAMGFALDTGNQDMFVDYPQ